MAALVELLGIDIEKGTLEETYGVGGLTATFLHDITLYIPGGPVQIRVAFSDNLPVAGILGMTGFFEYFQITFDPIAELCEVHRIFQA